MSTTFTLDFGALCPAPTAQIVTQKLYILKTTGELLDMIAKGLTFAHIQGVLTDKEIHKAQQRLIKWAGQRVYQAPFECGERWFGDPEVPKTPKKGRKRQ